MLANVTHLETVLDPLAMGYMVSEGAARPTTSFDS